MQLVSAPATVAPPRGPGSSAKPLVIGLAGTALVIAVLVAGALVIPAIWGSKIYVGMSAAAFRKTVLWLLVGAGFFMLAAALRAIL